MRLIRGTSARLRWSNSESSRIQTRRICIAGVFAAQVDQFIGEVLAGHCARCSRFSDSLRAFENQATFGLRPGQENACDGRDELARSLGTRLFCVLRAKDIAGCRAQMTKHGYNSPYRSESSSSIVCSEGCANTAESRQLNLPHSSAPKVSLTPSV